MRDFAEVRRRRDRHCMSVCFDLRTHPALTTTTSLTLHRRHGQGEGEAKCGGGGPGGGLGVCVGGWEDEWKKKKNRARA